MDPSGSQRIALLSIKPEYARAILAGRKTVEFRRSRIAPDIEIAVVYATQPVGQIVGWFRVRGIAESTPDGLWRRFRRNGAIGRADYFAYFDGAARAYGIEIVDATEVAVPFALDWLSPGLRAPQSFQYLPAGVVAKFVAPRRSKPQRPTFRPRLA